MIRQHLYLMVFFLFVLVVSYLVQHRYYQPHQTNTTIEPTVDYPDQFANRVDWISWDTTGQPVNRLETIRLEHFPGQQGTILFQPRLKVKKTASETWLAQSESAWIPDAQKLIHLEKDVHVKLQSATSTTLVSTQLTIDIENSQAYTDSPVEIKSKHGVITSTGITADFKTGKIILRKKVRGKHDTSRD